MKKLLLLLAIAPLSYADTNANAPKLTNPGQANPTMKEDKQNTELKARVLTTLAAAKPRFFAAAKVGGSALAIGYLGYNIFKLIRDAFFPRNSEYKEDGTWGYSYHFRGLNVLRDDNRDLTATNILYSAVCGYVGYKFLDVIVKNAPIVIKGKI